MKRKTLSLLLASMLCLLILCPSFLPADADVRMEPAETAETILDLSTEDPETFGGLYYDEEMQLVYCYVGGLEDVPAQLQGRSSGVRLQQVERSMAELEAMKDALVPYMNDYVIFSLDADEMTNKVRIEVYERSPALEQLLENDADSYEIVEVGDIQVDDLLLSAEEHQA